MRSQKASALTTPARVSGGFLASGLLEVPAVVDGVAAARHFFQTHHAQDGHVVFQGADAGRRRRCLIWFWKASMSRSRSGDWPSMMAGCFSLSISEEVSSTLSTSLDLHLGLVGDVQHLVHLFHGGIETVGIRHCRGWCRWHPRHSARPRRRNGRSGCRTDGPAAPSAAAGWRWRRLRRHAACAWARRRARNATGGDGGSAAPVTEKNLRRSMVPSWLVRFQPGFQAGSIARSRPLGVNLSIGLMGMALMDRRYLLKNSLALGGLVGLGGCATPPRAPAAKVVSNVPIEDRAAAAGADPRPCRPPVRHQGLPPAVPDQGPQPGRRADRRRHGGAQLRPWRQRLVAVLGLGRHAGAEGHVLQPQEGRGDRLRHHRPDLGDHRPAGRAPR